MILSEEKKRIAVNPDDMKKIVEERYQRYITELIDAHKGEALISIDRKEITGQVLPFGANVAKTVPIIAFTFAVDETKLTEYRKTKKFE